MNPLVLVGMQGALVMALILGGLEPAAALYQSSGESWDLQLTGSVNTGLGLFVYPRDTFLYDSQEETVWSGDFRMVAEGQYGEMLRVEGNILQNYRSAPSFWQAGSRSRQSDVERSALLYWQQHDGDNTQADLVFDGAQLAIGDRFRELLIGRQPISLSVTFYFTPNDFFAPFAPQNFYRLYKPGVDAVRFEQRLADLAQFSLVGVLGYDMDQDSDSGWTRAPSWERTSLLARYIRNVDDWELGLLGGMVRQGWIFGASCQGELFDWLGIRSEGHYLNTWEEGQENGLKMSIGLEHRFASSLTLRLEQMYNATGYASVAEAEAALLAGTLRPGYLGRHYTALDMGYEFTPLLAGEFLYLRNWTDGSQSFSVYGIISLSDESELAVTVTVPEGTTPDNASIGSEMGLQPARYTVEYRIYF